jgi:hypothetical protein
MGTSKKRSLPLTGRPGAPPNVDAARRRLGGRAAPSTNDAGRVVSLREGGDVEVVGVVLYGAEEELDVWIEGGIVRRVHPSRVVDFAGMVPEDVARMASDARTFSRLREGQRVRFESPGTTEGDLVEKCRYGALVLRGDGKLMAVGFRRLWPVQPIVDKPN